MKKLRSSDKITDKANSSTLGQTGPRRGKDMSEDGVGSKGMPEDQVMSKMRGPKVRQK
jgi:hypothetical protein